MARWAVGGAAAWIVGWWLLSHLDDPVLYVIYELTPQPIVDWYDRL